MVSLSKYIVPVTGISRADILVLVLTVLGQLGAKHLEGPVLLVADNEVHHAQLLGLPLAHTRVSVPPPPWDSAPLHWLLHATCS